MIDAGTRILDPVARTEYEAIEVPVAERAAASRVKPFAKVLAERLHPQTLTERHEEARAERAIRIVDLPDGMAEIIAALPAAIAHGILDRLSRIARRVKVAATDGGAHAGGFDVDSDHEERAKDPRSMEELCADVLPDLLFTGDPTAQGGATGLGAITTQVQMVVPVLTLIGASEVPATLVGLGPIDSETARRLAGGAFGWDRVLTHPVSGDVIDVDRYRAGKKLRRLLQVRDQHCRFPGCRLPTTK